MKIVINDNWGGFKLPEGFAKQYGYDWVYEDSEEVRTSDELIKYVDDINNNDAGSLVVVEVPDEATDWRIFEYDGAETVWYVVDGKMYMI